MTAIWRPSLERNIGMEIQSDLDFLNGRISRLIPFPVFLRVLNCHNMSILSNLFHLSIDWVMRPISMPGFLSNLPTFLMHPILSCIIILVSRTILRNHSSCSFMFNQQNPLSPKQFTPPHQDSKRLPFCPKLPKQ